VSYDYIIYARADRLPNARELAQYLRDAGGRVTFVEALNIVDARGLVLAWLDVKTTDFEVSVWPITDQDRQDYQHYAEVPDCDIEITLGCQGEASIRAGRIVADALANASGGRFCDPQTGEEWVGERPSS
jgi:hypothetical protein